MCSTSRENQNDELCRAVGEHAITVSIVQWCKRDPSAADDRKLTFVYYPMVEVTVINASEIRLELSGADEPKVLAAPKRVTRPRPRSAIARGSSAAERAAAATSRGSAKSCSDGLLGSYALRARGSEVMPPSGALVGPGPSYCIGSLCSTVRLLAPGHVQVRARVLRVRAVGRLPGAAAECLIYRKLLGFSTLCF